MNKHDYIFLEVCFVVFIGFPFGVIPWMYGFYELFIKNIKFV